MNIAKDTCANCASFYPGDGTTTPHCGNAQLDTPQELRRAPVASDYCCEHQHSTGANAWHGSPGSYRRTFMLALSLAPETMIEEIGGMLQEDGLMPKACGYLEDGTPIFNMEEIAEELGVPKDEARDSALHFLAICTEQDLPTGLIDPDKVHMLQYPQKVTFVVFTERVRFQTEALHLHAQLEPHLGTSFKPCVKVSHVKYYPVCF